MGKIGFLAPPVGVAGAAHNQSRSGKALRVTVRGMLAISIVSTFGVLSAPGAVAAQTITASQELANAQGNVSAGGIDGATTWDSKFLAQTFTVTTSGPITRIDLLIATDAPLPTSATATVALLAVDGSGVPVGSALSSDSTSVDSLPRWDGSLNYPWTVFSFDSPVAAESGDQFAIQVTTDWAKGAGSQNGVYVLGANPGSVYADGGFFLKFSGGNATPTTYGLLNADATFRVYVGYPDVDASQIPPPVLQQVGLLPGQRCADLVAPELNWAEVSSGGWSQSWAEWAVPTTGGFVCSRELFYDSSRSRWAVRG